MLDNRNLYKYVMNEGDEYDCPSKSCDHFLIVLGKNDVGTIRCLYTENKNIQIQRFCFLKRKFDSFILKKPPQAL